MNVLVTAAYEGELAGLPEDILHAPVGIGGIAAAAGATELILAAQPDWVVFVGTCGTYGEHELGNLLTPSEVYYWDPQIATGEAHLPADLYPPIALLPWDGYPETVCFQTPHISLAAMDAEGVEHLELYAVAYAAQRLNVQVTALLGVSNVVGPDGHKEWQQYHREVEQALVEAVIAWHKSLTAF